MNVNDKYKTIAEWAAAYRKLGWNVIPLYEYSKNPNTNKEMPRYVDDAGHTRRGWFPLQTRLINDEEFENWFVKTQPTGLGVICGKMSEIFVVDEDSYKADGMEFEFKSPMRSRTARGGTHHFFKYVDGIKTSGFRKGVNIEIKSEGGFAVLPPSEVYNNEIEKKITKYSWETVCALDKLPTMTEEKLSKYRGSQIEGEFTDMHDFMGAQLGSQHNSLRTLALKVFNKFKESEWDIAAQFIRDAAAKYQPPHPPYRVEKIIKDCSAYVKTHPKEESKSVVQGSHRKPRTLTEVALERQMEKDAEKTAPTTGYPALDKILRGFIPGRLYTLTGETNLGKTAMCVNFAHRLSLQGKKILYFALEPENTIVDYLASVRTDKMYMELTEDDLAHDPGNISVYGKQEISTMYDLLNVVRKSETRYDLIVIDHIGYFIKNQGNIFQEQSMAIKQLAGLAKEKRSAIMMIAHLRKRPQGMKKQYVPSADDIAGSGAFKQDSTDVLVMTRKFEDEEQFILSNEGKLYVMKTKSGPNGVIDIYFATQKAAIKTIDEIMNDPNAEIGHKLTAMGFKDNEKKKPKPN